MKQKRILLLIESMAAGGAQTQILQLGKFLSTLGYSTTYMTHFDDQFHESAADNVICVPRGRKVNTLCFILRYLSAIKSRNFDLVIAYGATCSVIAEIAKMILGIPVIVSERNLSEKGGIGPFLRRLGHLVADRLVVNSQAQLEFLKNNYGWLDPILIRNSVPDKVSDLGRGLDKPRNDRKVRILGVGKYAPQKNINFLIEIANLLKSKYPQVEFRMDWYGDKTGEEKIEYFNLLNVAIDANGLTETFFLHPAIADISMAYSGSNIFVLPSLFEGTPNVALEAMSFGLPIVLTDVSDNRYLVNHGVNGFISQLNDPDSFADYIYSISHWDQRRLDAGAETSGRILKHLFGPGNLGKFEKLVVDILK
ncbi:glycosyltransferase [Litorivicinus sp.]|nr:glycosyltransferase [Litorivicinus sp.]